MRKGKNQGKCKSLVMILGIMALLFISGCNYHSSGEDKSACKKEGLELYSSGRQDIVQCIDEKTGIVYSFDNHFMDYCDDCCCD